MEAEHARAVVGGALVVGHGGAAAHHDEREGLRARGTPRADADAAVNEVNRLRAAAAEAAARARAEAEAATEGAASRERRDAEAARGEAAVLRVLAAAEARPRRPNWRGARHAARPRNWDGRASLAAAGAAAAAEVAG